MAVRVNKNLIELKVFFLEIVHPDLYSGKVWGFSIFSFCIPPGEILGRLLLRLLISPNRNLSIQKGFIRQGGINPAFRAPNYRLRSQFYRAEFCTLKVKNLVLKLHPFEFFCIFVILKIT